MMADIVTGVLGQGCWKTQNERGWSACDGTACRLLGFHAGQDALTSYTSAGLRQTIGFCGTTQSIYTKLQSQEYMGPGRWPILGYQSCSFRIALCRKEFESMFWKALKTLQFNGNGDLFSIVCKDLVTHNCCNECQENAMFFLSFKDILVPPLLAYTCISFKLNLSFSRCRKNKVKDEVISSVRRPKNCRTARFPPDLQAVNNLQCLPLIMFVDSSSKKELFQPLEAESRPWGDNT